MEQKSVKVKLNRATRRWIARHKGEVKMSEIKARTLDDIKKEYWNRCAELGSMSFDLSLLKGRIAEVQAQITALNAEANAMQKAEAEKGKDAQP